MSPFSIHTCTLYLEGQAGNHASMKLKGDSVVKAALDSQVTRESGLTKKSSTAVTCEEMFAKCVESNQIFVPNSENTWNYESSLRHEIPKAKAAIKQSVNQDILTAWNEKVSKLTMQGEFTKLLIEEEESVTWQSIVITREGASQKCHVFLCQARLQCPPLS